MTSLIVHLNELEVLLGNARTLPFEPVNFDADEFFEAMRQIALLRAEIAPIDVAFIGAGYDLSEAVHTHERDPNLETIKLVARALARYRAAALS